MKVTHTFDPHAHAVSYTHCLPSVVSMSRDRRFHEYRCSIPAVPREVYYQPTRREGIVLVWFDVQPFIYGAGFLAIVGVVMWAAQVLN